MVERHEPDSRFVENLEWQISSELRSIIEARRALGDKITSITATVNGSVSNTGDNRNFDSSVNPVQPNNLAENRRQHVLDLEKRLNNELGNEFGINIDLVEGNVDYNEDQPIGDVEADRNAHFTEVTVTYDQSVTTRTEIRLGKLEPSLDDRNMRDPECEAQAAD